MVERGGTDQLRSGGGLARKATPPKARPRKGLSVASEEQGMCAAVGGAAKDGDAFVTVRTSPLDVGVRGDVCARVDLVASHGVEGLRLAQPARQLDALHVRWARQTGS